MSEATHPDSEGGYEVPPPTRCHACTARHIHEERYADAKPGLMFEVTKRRRG